MLYPAKQIRKECGNISPMTYWRWINYHGFPKPTKINNRNYHNEEQRSTHIPKWIKEKNANEAVT